MGKQISSPKLLVDLHTLRGSALPVFQKFCGLKNKYALIGLRHEKDINMLLLSLAVTYPMSTLAENITLMKGNAVAANPAHGLPTYVHIVKAASKPPEVTMNSYKKPIEDAVNKLRKQAVEKLKIVGQNYCNPPEQQPLFDEMDVSLTYIEQYNLPVITLQANIHRRANVNVNVNVK